MSKNLTVNPIEWQGDRVVLIDQTVLPHIYQTVEITSWQAMAEAIKTMIVRGAPAIGVAASYGMYLGAKEISTNNREQFFRELWAIAENLKATRPTAVNLFWAIDKIWQTLQQTIGDVDTLKNTLLETAKKIQADDLQTCRAIGDHGLSVLPDEPNKLNILTHCNAGSLATAGYGTALGVVRSAWQADRLARVYADETRPRLQGAKLTTWECVQEGIPVTLLTDNMAAHAMKSGLIHVVIVGADRITANGDAANKIGTYGLALISKAHHIPFFVAAPVSTIDFQLETGDEIVIEERDPVEVYQIGDTRICPEGVDFYNPAFDVTPASLIEGIITEYGVFSPHELRQLQTMKKSF